jgi:uncharacterized membrane protein
MPNSLNALRLSTVARLGSPGEGENTMDEKNLLDLWNTKRTQIIKAQMAPNLMLIGIFVLAAFGKFDGATDGAKYLTIGVAATTGILSMITQYATIREAEALMIDLNRLDKPSEIAKKVAQSRGLLSLSAIAIVGLGIAVFALVVWAVLG